MLIKVAFGNTCRIASNACEVRFLRCGTARQLRGNAYHVFYVVAGSCWLAMLSSDVNRSTIAPRSEALPPNVATKLFTDASRSSGATYQDDPEGNRGIEPCPLSRNLGRFGRVSSPNAQCGKCEKFR